MKTEKRIVIISSGQPTANPRAVKEALALHKEGYTVTFIYCPLSPWADRFDEKLFSDHPGIIWIPVGYHPLKQKWGYRFARLRKKVYGMSEQSVRSYAMFSQELKMEALRHPADLYLGHNLGAIEATVNAAGFHKAKAGFDAEDFHRGEFLEKDHQKETTVTIENKYFPLLNYCTVAAPLIGKAYAKIFPGKLFTTLNNVFSAQNLQNEGSNKSKPGLDLFWFSQFIGPSRGIETVIGALNKCSDYDIRLHLLGNITDAYREELSESITNTGKLLFLSPTEPDNIFKVATKFDIGLATEIPITLNREYCLTNKLFTYLLSGNCILMSGTKAQAEFAATYPGIGMVYEPYDEAQLAHFIRQLYDDRALLAQMKANSLKLAKEKLNLEHESLIFLRLVNTVLSTN